MNPKSTPGVGWRLAILGGLAALVAASGAAVPADAPAIVYEGRFAPGGDGAVRLAYPGVTIHLGYRGPGLVLRANAAADDLYFDASVDGGPFTAIKLHRGEDAYPVAASGAEAEHTVILVRRNEAWHGLVTILGFDPGAGGVILPAPPLPERKLMFIGDSVTCGELAAWEPGRDLKDHANWGPRLSYGMLLAHRLGAQCHLVSYGGRGLVRDWQGIRNTNNAPQFYELALPDDPAAPWDHARYVPDAIGVELGQNDFSTGIPDQVEYVTAYVQFVQKLRRDAPRAVIFLLQSPMQSDRPNPDDARRAALLACLTQVVERFHSPLVRLAPVGYHPGVPGNGHPSGADHAAMADELEPLFRKALGW